MFNVIDTHCRSVSIPIASRYRYPMPYPIPGGCFFWLLGPWPWQIPALIGLKPTHRIPQGLRGAEIKPETAACIYI